MADEGREGGREGGRGGSVCVVISVGGTTHLSPSGCVEQPGLAPASSRQETTSLCPLSLATWRLVLTHIRGVGQTCIYILCVYMLMQCGVWCVCILYIYLCSVCVAVSGGTPPSSSASTHSVWPC